MNILISTDTSAVVSYESLKKSGVSVFPLNVIIDGQEYLDTVTITQDELKTAMRSNKKIQTSTPPLGVVIDYFENLLAQGYDHIIHFTISSKLSSMNDLFTNVAKSNFAGKVTVIDSLSLSSAMFQLVLTALEMAKNGASVEEIVSEIEKTKKENKVVFIPENLTALKNGGRISPTVAVIGNMIGIKPVIELQDGALEKTGTTNNVRRVFVQKMEEYAKTYPTDEYDFTFFHFDANELTFNFLLDKLKEILKIETIVQGLLPINVCAHCGPGTIGLIVTKKVLGKSLIEFM